MSDSVKDISTVLRKVRSLFKIALKSTHLTETVLFTFSGLVCIDIMAATRKLQGKFPSKRVSHKFQQLKM